MINLLKVITISILLLVEPGFGKTTPQQSAADALLDFQAAYPRGFDHMAREFEEIIGPKEMVKFRYEFESIATLSVNFNEIHYPHLKRIITNSKDRKEAILVLLRARDDLVDLRRCIDSIVIGAMAEIDNIRQSKLAKTVGRFYKAERSFSLRLGLEADILMTMEAGGMAQP